MAADLSNGGRTVISGGAYGIDAAAHRGALAGRIPTIVVLANGVDLSHPPAHSPLFRRVAERGLIISELPPGALPTRTRFHARNRVLAALSQGTVLVEAASRSGARNTVAWAHAIGRAVMAVPGPVTSAQSQAPHRLISERRARLVTSGADIVDHLAATALSPVASPLQTAAGWEHISGPAPGRSAPPPSSSALQPRAIRP